MEKSSGPNELNRSIFVKTQNAAEEGAPHIFNVKLEDFMRLPPPLGLKLSASAVNEIKDLWNAKERAKKGASIPNRKSTNVYFYATLLKIGEFKFEPRHEGELMVRFNFAKQRFMWEILDKSKSTKHKVEVLWHNILAMRIAIEDNMPGILEIELEKEPEFYQEIKIQPSPRSHTMWESSEDFTRGHALTYRRHYLEFLPGVLDKHYEKLLQSDSHFLELSKLPTKSPYFGPALLDERGADNSHVHDLLGWETNPTSHQQPALSISPQQQFGNTMPPTSLTHSIPPTSVVANTSSSDINRFNNLIPQEPKSTSKRQSLDCSMDNENSEDIAWIIDAIDFEELDMILRD